MQILKRVAIFLFIFITFIHSCQKGCLTCNSNNECLLCDNVMFYVLEDKVCVQKSELSNCLRINAAGKCLQCQSNYFLDLTTQKCVIVPASEQILHCELYDTNKQCSLCSRNRYFLNGECQLVEQQIDFCRSQFSNTQCNKCEDLYLLDIDKSKCLRTSGVPFCGGYNLFTCINCKEGYFLNKNAEIEENIALTNSAQRSILSQILNDVYSSSNEFKRNKVCQKITVENCKENLTFDKCEVCKEGSFLNENLNCIENPLPAIANCKVYKTATQCLECQDRYFLNNNICQAVTEIENCILYDGTRSNTVCKQCREGYYSNGTQCVQRTNTQIQNCKIYSNDKDRCNECQSGYVVSSDGLKCFSTIDNCEVYNTSSSTTQQISCQKCKSGYYLEDQFQCVAGTDNNCEIFATIDQCQICKNGYFLNSNNKCDAQPTLPNCELYSTSVQGECKQCEGNYFNFKVEQYCEFRTAISNCIEYTNQDPLQCTKCELGYYLLNNQCMLITIQNCVEQIDNNCVSCAKGYALATVNNIVSCVEPFTFTKMNCDIQSVQEQDNNSIQLKDNQCLYCQSYHYPVDFNQQYVCVKDDQVQYLDLTLSNLIQNCLKFTNQGVCLQCVKGYYLEGDQCVQSCQSGVHKTLNYDKTLNNGIYLISIENYKVCTALYQSEGVQSLGIDLFFENPNELDIIIECENNRLPVISLSSQKYTNMQPANELKDIVKTPNEIHPAIQQCVQPTQNSPIMPNCKYYRNKSISTTNQQRCFKCDFQYTSKIQIENSVSVLSQCQQYTQCSSKMYTAGLDLVWQKIFSCHVCTDSTQIPVVFMEMTAVDKPYPKNFRRYTLSSLSRIDDTKVDSINIQCMVVNAQNLGYDTSTSSQMQYYKNLPENCALAAVNLNVDDGDARLNQTVQVLGVSSVKVAHFCVACKPGYKGIRMNDVFSYIKVQCSLIENCVGLDWLNQCSQCNTGYIYEFSNGQINYDKCISNNVSNCYAASSVDKCVFCKRGYVLNRDYKCEQIKPANCEDFENFNFRVQYTQRTLSYGLYHGYTGVGCSKCQTGYKAILQTSLIDSYQCIYSSYIQQNYQNLPENSFFIKNCTNYGFVTDQIVCKKCATGFVRSQNALKCYIGSSDCELSTSDNVCFKCKEGIYLVNGKCLTNQISYCKIPSNDENNAQPKCKQCQPSYYITTDFKCEFGQVSNCEIYKQFQGKKCDKCLDGYALYIGSSNDYCYKLDNSLNCNDAELKSNSVYGASLQCTKCIQPNYILTTILGNNINSTICMEFQIIDNCLIYDKAQTLQQSTLKCLQCSQGYFLASSSSCVARKNISTACLEYNQNIDSCQKCQDLFYIGPQGLCRQNPSGIAYCAVYENSTTCQRCQPDYYLLNNQCLNVPNTNLVSGCLYYKDQNICDECKPNYVLVGQICETAQAKNCLTYTSVKKCESCPKGYVLEIQDDITNCKQYTKPNCVEFDQFGDYPCLICQPHYYPDSLGECQAVNPRIPSCKIYLNNDICIQCESGMILNSDGTSCLNLSNTIALKIKQIVLFVNLVFISKKINVQNVKLIIVSIVNQLIVQFVKYVKLIIT